MTIAEYPGTMMTDSLEELTHKCDTDLCDNVVKALTIKPLPAPKVKRVKEPGKKDIVYSGSLEEINDYFYDRQWTDGLPIVPPTIEKVERFLEFTDHSAEEILGILPHENREATVWSVAVNGVMAGCRPEYMPVLLAAAQAVCDPKWRAQDTGTTPGWEPLIIVTGRIIKDLDFNCGQGNMRFGRRANTSIGRFLKLFLMNVGGFRIPPGTGDKGSVGQSMNVVLAENEDAVRALGWPLFAQDKGYEDGESTVTVTSSAFISPPTYSAGATPEEHLEIIDEIMGRRACASYAVWAVHTMVYSPVFMFSPAVADVFAKHGWSKDMLRKHFFENIRVEARWIERMSMDFNGNKLDLCDRVKAGFLPPEYCECSEPSRLVKVFPDPESIQIVVSGDPSRNQSKVFVNSGYIGNPTTKKVDLPNGWDEKIRLQPV